MEFPENKLTKYQWGTLKLYLENYSGELHRCAGKKYEYLRFLSPMSVNDHRGKNPARNYKYPDKVPEDVQQDNISFWKTLIYEEDWLYFVEKGLV